MKKRPARTKDLEGPEAATRCPWKTPSSEDSVQGIWFVIHKREKRKEKQKWDVTHGYRVKESVNRDPGTQGSHFDEEEFQENYEDFATFRKKSDGIGAKWKDARSNGRNNKLCNCIKDGKRSQLDKLHKRRWYSKMRSWSKILKNTEWSKERVKK